MSRPIWQAASESRRLVERTARLDAAQPKSRFRRGHENWGRGREGKASSVVPLEGDIRVPHLAGCHSERREAPKDLIPKGNWIAINPNSGLKSSYKAGANSIGSLTASDPVGLIV